jgi:hypothetical protein
MSARFFVDENDLALGKAPAAVHDGVVYPGHPELPQVPRQTPDDAWLPIIGARGLVVITCDKRIRDRPVERRAWLTYGVRGFVLTGTGSQSSTDGVAMPSTRTTRLSRCLRTVGCPVAFHAITHLRVSMRDSGAERLIHR